MKEKYKKVILEKIKEAGKIPLPYAKLKKACRIKNSEFAQFTGTLEGLKKNGEIYEQRSGFLMPDMTGLEKAKVVRLNKTYGFVKTIDDEIEIFIPGRFLKGAMPGDIVMVRQLEAQGESPEGEVVSIVTAEFSQFTGNITLENIKPEVIPDVLSKYAMPIDNHKDFELSEGDKVLCEITSRGQRHSEHSCKVIAVFGSSEKASVCAMSVLELNGIRHAFPDEVIAEAKLVTDYDIIQREAKNRLDLRDEVIFTIDGADTKDIDDAVSIKKTVSGYELGVHIADVSHYVKARSELDSEALQRGTSVYYANKVVPMLPAELSNGICSLNPQEDRLAFSAIMQLDYEGKLESFKFVKTVIRSRIKGVYSEINSILNGTQTEQIAKKYEEVMGELSLMTELSRILAHNKKQRGAPSLETSESKLIIDENDVCVDVKPRTRGMSEEIIEDFMLTANEAAARLGFENDLPFVYRIHENPSMDKISQLEETLRVLGVTIPNYKTIKPKHMSAILESVKGSGLEMVVNNLVLRSMAKAKYSPEPIGHFGLVLKDYTHFTSPIRRYPDLSIHRIMSDFLDGMSKSDIMKKYQKFVFHSSQSSTDAELKAMKVERDCEDCYKAEYMSKHLGETFEGRIVSVTDYGFFVELENTCEGLVRTADMPQGEYVYDGAMKLTHVGSSVSYRIGDMVRVKVAKAVVSSGQVDFVLDTEV